MQKTNMVVKLFSSKDPIPIHKIMLGREPQVKNVQQTFNVQNNFEHRNYVFWRMLEHP